MTAPRQAGADTRGFLREIRQVLPALEVATVFDVGANKGQSLRKLVPAFPAATIHAFEPAPGAFAELTARFGGRAGVHLHRLALGAAAGRVRMTADGARSGNRILAPAGADRILAPAGADRSLAPAGADRSLAPAVADGILAPAGADGILAPAGADGLPEIDPEADATPTCEVEMVAGDDFCAGRGIDAIDLLKIDAEGHDLEALRGFSRLLGAGRIALVEVEAGLSPDNARHVPLGAFGDFLHPLGYRLFGVYDLVREFNRLPQLRRCNPVYISADAARRNRGPR